MAREMIKIEKLNKSFGDLQVLKNIDMTIHESDVVCLVGSSGSGKSNRTDIIRMMYTDNNLSRLKAHLKKAQKEENSIGKQEI